MSKMAAAKCRRKSSASTIGNADSVSTRSRRQTPKIPSRLIPQHQLEFFKGLKTALDREFGKHNDNEKVRKLPTIVDVSTLLQPVVRIERDLRFSNSPKSQEMDRKNQSSNSEGTELIDNSRLKLLTVACEDSSTSNHSTSVASKQKKHQGASEQEPSDAQSKLSSACENSQAREIELEKNPEDITLQSTSKVPTVQCQITVIPEVSTSTISHHEKAASQETKQRCSGEPVPVLSKVNISMLNLEKSTDSHDTPINIPYALDSSVDNPKRTAPLEGGQTEQEIREEFTFHKKPAVLDKAISMPKDINTVTTGNEKESHTPPVITIDELDLGIGKRKSTAENSQSSTQQKRPTTENSRDIISESYPQNLNKTQKRNQRAKRRRQSHSSFLPHVSQTESSKVNASFINHLPLYNFAPEQLPSFDPAPQMGIIEGPNPCPSTSHWSSVTECPFIHHQSPQAPNIVVVPIPFNTNTLPKCSQSQTMYTRRYK